MVVVIASSGLTGLPFCGLEAEAELRGALLCGPGAQQAQTGQESFYTYRASQNHDNGGN